MTCKDIAYPYLDHETGHHKHVGLVVEGTTCTTLIVRSNMVEVRIHTFPAVDDLGRVTPGITQFCREYPDSAPLTVALVAPASWREVDFQRWIINDVEQPLFQTNVNVEMNGIECVIAFAKYGSDIEPINCPGVTLPSHMLVSLTSSCGIIDNVGGLSGTGTSCLPAVWQARGLSVTVVNDGISPNWVGERFFRTCPVNATGLILRPCVNNDCTEVVPNIGVPIPQCVPHETATVNLWATKQWASFGISCFCNPETNIVTVNYGIGFAKEGCNSFLHYQHGPVPPPEPDPNICGGGSAGWVCNVRSHISFNPQYVTPAVLTAPFDGTQEDCEDTVRQLVSNADFTTTFSLTAHTGPLVPPPLVREMQCTGIINVT